MKGYIHFQSVRPNTYIKLTNQRQLLRSLQRYTVQITPKLFNQNSTAFEPLRDGEFHALISPELNYSNEFGLILDEAHAGNQFLNVSN